MIHHLYQECLKTDQMSNEVLLRSDRHTDAAKTTSL